MGREVERLHQHVALLSALGFSILLERERERESETENETECGGACQRLHYHVTLLHGRG